MMNYDYREAMIADILDYIRENYTEEQIEELAPGSAEWEELNDALWVCDSVTGNASGSYWFSAYKAEEAVCHNWHLLAEAMEEFCYDRVNVIGKGAEWCDVLIRCYLLSDAICAALEELENEVQIPG
jgi:hypothetical protein